MCFADARIDLDEPSTTQRRPPATYPRGKGRRTGPYRFTRDWSPLSMPGSPYAGDWPFAGTSTVGVRQPRRGRAVRPRCRRDHRRNAATRISATVVTPLILSHSCGTDLVRSGTNLVTVVELLDHVSGTVTAARDADPDIYRSTEDDLDAVAPGSSSTAKVARPATPIPTHQ
jgi:hypothetical protein